MTYISLEEVTTVVPTIDPIEAIDRAESEGIDTWELLVATGAADEEEMAIRRWRKGDCALRVEKHYGSDAIRAYADQIGTNPNTLKQYRQMSGFYEKSTRVLFPNLFYSHYRTAMSLGDDALWALRKASVKDWPCWKFAKLVKRLLGKHPIECLQTEATVSRRYTQDDGLYLVLRLSTDFPVKPGQTVKVKAAA